MARLPVQNLTQLAAINDGIVSEQVWVVAEGKSYTACPPGTAGAIAGRNCGWVAGDVTPGEGGGGAASYPDCQYVAPGVVTDLANQTQWDPAGLANAGDKFLLPFAGTGAKVGIFVADDSNGLALVTDPTFTTIEGATVTAIRSPGSPTYRQTAATGSGTAVFVSNTSFGDAITSPRFLPNFNSAAALALSSDAAASFPAITFSGLLASSTYNAVIGVRVTQYIDGNEGTQATIDIKAQLSIYTDSSGVATVTISPAVSPDVSLVPSALTGATASLIASAGGVTVTATRASGVPSHAQYSATINEFKYVGAHLISLPSDLAGLVYWHRRGVLVTDSSGTLVTWGDSGPNGVTYTSAHSRITYSATGGPGNGPRLMCGGTVDVLLMPDGLLSSLDLTALQAFWVLKRATDPPTTGIGGLHRINNDPGDVAVVPFTDGKIYDNFASTARHDTGVNTAGAMASVCCYSAYSKNGEWTARLNGSQIYTTASNTFGLNATGMTQMGQDSPAWVDGEYYEDFAFDHKLSTNDQAKISAYVNSIYGVSA